MKKHVKKYFIPHEENDHKPHFFREHSVFTVFVVIVLLFGLSFSLTEVVKRTDLVAAIYPGVLVDLTNESRLANRKEPLRLSPLLAQVAQSKSDHMAENSYFAHVSPDGKTPWYWFERAGYQFIYAGENLAVDFSHSADVSRAWLNSPTHRANILNEHFTEIGIATSRGYYKGRPTIFVTQSFGRPTAQTVLAQSNQAEEVPEEVVEEEDITEEDSEVLGATEPDLEVIEQTDTFVAVRNNTAAVEAASEVDVPEDLRYSRWFDRFLVSPGTLVQYLYNAILIIVLIALLLMVGIEIRKQHPKNIIYGVMLIALTLLLMFLNQELIIADILIV